MHGGAVVSITSVGIIATLTSSYAEQSPVKIAVERLADLLLLAIQTQLNDQEATSGYC